MEDFLKDLNSEQKIAVTHGTGSLLIVAGAGTGKTTVITKRLAWLILNKIAEPQEILALTFTDKAANEMEERVDKLLPYGYVDLWVCTFHAFCERVLKAHALDIGLPPDFKLLNQTEQWLLLRKNLERLKLDYYRPLGNPTKFLHALLKHFSRAKDEAVRPEDYLSYVKGLRLNADSPNDQFPISNFQTNPKSKIQNSKEDVEIIDTQRLDEITNAYHIYQRLLLENNALDFGDLINYTLELFQKRPKILAQYRRQFKYVLVDEFQDTNWAQYELIKILAAPNNNLAVVGDDDQSIYKFRGASVANILQFKKDYPRAEEIVLTKNYRNRQNILDIAYNFIQQNNPDRLEFQLSQEKKLSKRLEAQKPGEGICQELLADNYLKEARLAADEIIRLQKKNKDASFDDYAVLLRANSYAEPFMKVFSDYGLPYNFVASRGLYLKKVVMDIVAYLQMLDNYHESQFFFRVLNLSIFNLSAETIISLSHYAAKKTISLFEAARGASLIAGIAKEEQEKINRLLGLISQHTNLVKTASVGKVVMAFLEETGYLKNLIKQDSDSSRMELDYLNQFYKKVQEFETTESEPSVRNFIESLKLEIEAGEEGALIADLEQGPEAIKIMTVHSAKGLEFRYVLVANLVDKRFPSVERPDPIELPVALIKETLPQGDAHLQEERRLFYVALTRAKEGVYLTRALDYGGARAKKPSRFLYELGIVKEEKIIKKKEKAENSFSKQALAEKISSTDGSRAKQNQNLPPYFSYTQYRAFKTCPLQYKFAQVLKIPVRGKGTFSFGKTMHQTLYHFYHLIQERAQNKLNVLFGSNKIQVEQKINAPSLDELLKIYQNNWIDEWYESAQSKKEYFKKGEDILKKFYADNQNSFSAPLHLEQGFFLKIDDFTIKGAIDRVDKLPDGRVEIIDYKTGKGKTEETLDEEAKEQLIIYQLAASDILREQPAKLTFYYLETGQKLSFLGTEKDIEKTKNNFKTAFEELKTSDFQATPSVHKCRFCDFAGICDFRELA